MPLWWKRLVDAARAYWQWLVGGLLLLVGFFLGTRLRRRPDPVVEGPRQEAENEEAALADAAEKERVAASLRAKQEHDKAVQDSVSALTSDAEELATDPDALNAYLKEVGEEVRGRK